VRRSCRAHAHDDADTAAGEVELIDLLRAPAALKPSRSGWSVSRPVRNVTPLTAWLSLHPKTDAPRARPELIILDEGGTQGGGRAPQQGWRNAPCEPPTNRSQDGGEWSVKNAERKRGAMAVPNEPNGNPGNLARDLSAHAADAKRSRWGFG